MMLKFYGLYKQAVEGPCTDPKPAFYEVVKGYKWRAWSNLGTMTQAQAKTCYVEELKKVSYVSVTLSSIVVCSRQYPLIVEILFISGLLVSKTVPSTSSLSLVFPFL